MIKIGIVGEHIDNDSKPMKILLTKRYDKDICQFLPILRNIKGSDLDAKNKKKIIDLINAKRKQKKLDFIIFLRDLDAHPKDDKKTKKRNDWFNSLNKETGKNNLFFLIIYELEALIFADIKTFNKRYKTKLTLKQNPLFIEDPKGQLIAASLGKNQYKESHAQDIFKDMDFDIVHQKHQHKNHPCFHQFITKLDERLN